MRHKSNPVLCITSAGRRVALLRSLQQDARLLGKRATLLAVDSEPALSAACAGADVSLAVPRCTAEEYIDVLLAACTQHDVSIVIPTIDTELPILSAALERFAAQSIFLACSSTQAVAVVRNKQATIDCLLGAGVLTPKSAPLDDLLTGRAIIRGPLVLKHLNGSRSIGLHYVESIDAAGALKLDVSKYVAQERCIGPEYTVNCYVDQSGSLRAAVPHRRIEVRDGEVSKGKTERRADLSDIAKQIVKAIPGLRGPFCFQAILTAEGPKVFEINARFGGGYPLAHAAGATFGKWLIEESLGLLCTANDEWQDGLLMLRYDAAVFVKPNTNHP